MKNLAIAILNVMKDVKGIDKSMTVGTGNSSYKGVPDQEVKKIIGESMAKNGLTILPIGIEPTTKIERWEEETFYNGKSNGLKTKQSVFTEVKTKYLLLHESGESMELQGYGHGVDSQDKGAGKATTYALKYTLLYTFLVPTGKIDDSDNDHSDNKEVPKTQPPVISKTQPPVKKLPEMKTGTVAFDSAKLKLSTGEITMEDVQAKFTVSTEIKNLLLNHKLQQPNHATAN
jgi:hypothetical protein